MAAEPGAARSPMHEIVGYFLRLGMLGFGGPVALVGLMEKDLVQERQWLSKDEMRDAIAVSQSLPGPLAIQVGIFIAYLRGGFWGAWAGGWAFILPNFLIVAALGALYVHFGGLSWITAIFYGVSPAVIALILHSCWRLAKLGMEHWLQWLIAAVSFLVTVALETEVALLFIGAGIIGMAYYGTLLRGTKPPQALLALAPVAVGTSKAATASTLGQLLAFFLKAGSLTFGSGLVIVPFLEKGLVQQTQWLDAREFLVAVAVGMVSPGPVVITATFVGYLVAGFWGALVSTIGIFLPSFLLILVVAPILMRHRANRNVQGFVKGAYAAAIGTILGGMPVPTSMGSATAINFQPTGGGKAAITGDFVLIAKEVNAVAKTLRENGIEVTAVHNHMLDDQPRLFFMHFWANDDALKLAKGLRAALDKMNVAKS